MILRIKYFFLVRLFSTYFADQYMYHVICEVKYDMVIYGEYLFAENFIAGFLLIMLTGKLTGCIPRKVRLVLASLVCGVSSFIIFLPLGGVLSTLIRLTICLLTALTAFGSDQLIKKTAVMLVLTLLSGGAVMALLLWQQEPAITHQGIIYIDAVTYGKLLCFGVLAFGLTYWFVILIRRKNNDMDIKGRVSMIIDGKQYELRGYVDSGNSLKEPVSGKPVMLLDKKGAAKLPFKPADFSDRYTVIPYKAVGVQCGYLESIRTDRIVFNGKLSEGAWVAFYDGTFDGFEVLINKDFLEGGLLKNV